MNIPFNKTYFTGHEIENIVRALEISSVAGDGYFNKKVTELLENRMVGSKVLTTTSGTHALEMAMMLIDIKEGDEVIMPSYTFPSTANAVMLMGGKPVFVDIDEDTLTMSISELKKKITINTRAILPVHYGGVGCQMDKIMNLAEKYKLYVVEDAAQVLGSTYKGKQLGTFGHMGCFSFHGTKNYISGEGGALTIQSKDPILLERADVIRQKGTNRTQFMRGEVSQYTWVDIGSSYAPSDILMAVLYTQLIEMEQITEKRRFVVETYTNCLKEYVNKGIIYSMSHVPYDFQSNFHTFYILLKDRRTRDHVMKQLKRNRIDATTHFVPLHSSPMGGSIGYKREDLPITEKVASTLLRLPLYTDMRQDELEYATQILCQVLEGLS